MRLTDFTNTDLTVERVGAGGFGVVYIGPDRFLGQWMALKSLQPELLAKYPRLRDLFLKECLTWVGLWLHPNLLTAQSAAMIDGGIYLVLDYAEYGNLREVLTHDLPFDIRLTWAQHVAAGLVALHTPDPEFLRPRPLVHRDLKPENVLVDGEGFARITDFGLTAAVAAELAVGPLTEVEEAFALVDALAAQGTQGRSVTASRATRGARGGVGTVAYMPPEQWDAEGEVGTPADMYAFGLVLSELLAGRHGLTDLETPLDQEGWYRLHVQGTPRPLRSGPARGASLLPREAEDLYQSLLAKRPEDRPTAKEALAALQEVATTRGEQPYRVPDVHPRTDKHRAFKWSNWAGTCLCLGQLEEALDYNARALALAHAPNHFPIMNQQGNILAAMGNRALQAGDEVEAQRWYKEALPWADRALAIADTDRFRAIALAMRALRLSDLGWYAEAEEMYAHALALEPEDGTKWFNRALNAARWALTEAEAGRVSEVQRLYTFAEGYIREAARLAPGEPSIANLLASIRDERARIAKRH